LHSKPIQIKVQRINAHVNGEEEEEEMKKTSTESEKKIMMQCSLQVNDKQTAQRTGMDELAHELFLCAHRGWRPVVRSCSAG